MKKLIFDFDGTLVDSMQGWANFIFGHLDKLHINYPDNIIKIVSPLGTRGAANYLIELGVDSTVDDLLELMDSFALDEYTYRVPAKDHVIDKLHELKKVGYSLNILTACNHNLLDPCLKRLGIFDIFDNVWSSDDFGTGKADPKIYRLAAQRLGKTVDEVIFVDDNLGADKTAKSAGMTVYGIYDESSKDYVEDMKAATDAYLYTFEEILNL
jgi:HAD superfamily hydrolase (TIGR01509 family)